MELECSKLHNMDCVDGMAKLSPRSVNLAFADPPFNIGYEYDSYDDRRAKTDYLEWSRQWMSKVYDVLAGNGTFWLAIGDEYAAELKLIAQEIGFTCRSWVIWYYTFGVHCKTKFTRSHAHLFHFVKNPKNFVFHSEAIRVPSARQLVYADKRAAPGGRVPDDTWILRPQDVKNGFDPETNTWFFSRICGTFKQRAGWHGCQMPERLLERIIRVSSNPGDLVIDPFAGSGSTLLVAKKLHRNWVGFEVSKDYVKRARKRLDHVKPGDPIEGSENPLGSAPPTSRGRQLKTPRKSRRVSGSSSRVQGIPHRDVPRTMLPQPGLEDNEYSIAITRAFVATSDGYSIDRMLADPTLGSHFLQACRESALPGGPRQWYGRLLRLRKAGHLRHLPRPKRTVIPWDELDHFAFASEIAWRIVAEEAEGKSLDDILCTPRLLEKFDRTAERFAPGWTAFHYRWGALAIRKQAGRNTNGHATAPPDLKPLKSGFRRTRQSLDDTNRIPDGSGLYFLKAPDAALYLGETTSLRRRIELHQNHVSELLPKLGQERTSPQDVAVAFHLISDNNKDARWILRNPLVREWCPRGNHNPRYRGE